MYVVSVISAKERSSVTRLLKNCFIALSDRDVAHKCIHFCAENPIRMKLVGRSDDCGCFDIGARVGEAIRVEVEEAES